MLIDKIKKIEIKCDTIKWLGQLCRANTPFVSKIVIFTCNFTFIYLSKHDLTYLKLVE